MLTGEVTQGLVNNMSYNYTISSAKLVYKGGVMTVNRHKYGDRHLYSYVYKIANKVNGKTYVGVTSNPELRWREHRHAISDTSHNPMYIDMYNLGIDNFEMIIIEKCLTKDLFSREKYWISQLKSSEVGYNRTNGGLGGNTYLRKTPEELKIIGSKISEKLKGSGNGNKGQYVGDKNPMYGSYPHNKRLYIYDTYTDSSIPSIASEIKSKFNMHRLRNVKDAVMTRTKLLGRYYILESQETIESINVTLKGE